MKHFTQFFFILKGKSTHYKRFDLFWSSNVYILVVWGRKIISINSVMEKKSKGENIKSGKNMIDMINVIKENKLYVELNEKAEIG